MRSFLRIKEEVMKKIKILIVILLLLALGVLGAYHFLLGGMNGPFKNVDPSASLVEIQIPEGSSTRGIAEILVENGIVKDVLGFRVFSRINKYDGRFLAGNYKLSPGMTTEEIADILCTGGESKEISFTIPEGYTVGKIADKLSAEGLINWDRFMELAVRGDYSRYSFLEGAVQGRHQLEGFLFPETYSIPEDSTEEVFIEVMLNHFDEIWSKYKDRAAELSLTPNEVITMASLIEREAVLDEERPLVSSVIYNRLEQGMPLQMDATLDFILELQGNNHEYITYEDMDIDSPYNTYIIPGLPPGPIACPGEKAIEAALYPADTEYLYYVKTTDDGVGMSFSVDYEEFLQNKEAWEASIQNND